MGVNALDITTLLLAVILIVISTWKWHVVRDRSPILVVIRNAFSTRASLWVGILAGVAYLAVFMILGGRGGRVHVLFGRVIWNTTVGEVLVGILMAVLVTLSMSLFVFGAGVLGAQRSGRKGGIGIAGSLLAMLAAFCP
jgi:hypothetical protein